MIKKFLECTTIRERIDMLSNTVIDDWTEQDLNIILSALGLETDSIAAWADKISAIEKYLADYKHKVEMESTMNCGKIDSTPARDEGQTLYKEKSLIDALKKVINS